MIQKTDSGFAFPSRELTVVHRGVSWRGERINTLEFIVPRDDGRSRAFIACPECFERFDEKEFYQARLKHKDVYVVLEEEGKCFTGARVIQPTTGEVLYEL